MNKKALRNIHDKIIELAESLDVDTQSKEIDELCQHAEDLLLLIELEELEKEGEE